LRPEDAGNIGIPIVIAATTAVAPPTQSKLSELSLARLYVNDNDSVAAAILFKHISSHMKRFVLVLVEVL
jgi:hypothetical protein